MLHRYIVMLNAKVISLPSQNIPLSRVDQFKKAILLIKNMGFFSWIGYDRSISVLGGKKNEDLYESRRDFKTPHGNKIIASTDKGFNYKDINEDRVVISPEHELVVVIDGMGGEGQGSIAAHILAEEIIQTPNDIEVAAKSAKKRFDSEISTSKGGAVFISSQVIYKNSKPFLKVIQAGDAKVIIFNKKGELKFESKDEGQGHFVTNAVSKKLKLKLTTLPLIPLDSGDRVLLMSDGITDNLSPLKIIEETLGKSLDGLFETISVLTKFQMENHIPLRGLRLNSKPDNRALVAMDIK
jgi:serine/threonine protein phosphatase PrpC